MANVKIKFLTITIAALLSVGNLFSAEVITQEEFKTHLRWNVASSKDQIVINKSGNTFTIKTLDQDLYALLKTQFAKFPLNNSYFIKSELIDGVDVGTPSTVKVTLKSTEVELFTFYRNQESKYVIDFWVDRDEVNSEKAAIVKPLEIKETPKVIPQLEIKKEALVKQLPKKEPVVVKTNPLEKQGEAYRDYRYGSPFLWDYPELVPEVKKSLNMDSKTAEEFYHIKDREYEKSEKEAHLQLTLNLYKKKKYGLMNKSMKLFQEKYGEDTDVDFHEYLKANAILRESFGKKDMAPVKVALSMYRTISERTSIYDLKKAILIYLINFGLGNNDYVTTLKDAKNLFAVSRENFDYEEAGFAANVLLFTLAKLDQVEKINMVLEDKTLEKLVSKQSIIAYKIYAQLKSGHTVEAIKTYEDNRKSFAPPIHPSIMFNVAEAYFRDAQYERSVKVFEEFIKEYSGFSAAGYARLRVALASDLMGHNAKEIEEKYLSVINLSGVEEVRQEAQVRYVAIRTIRKNKRDAEDLETRVFLDVDEKNKDKTDKNMKKLLWLVRLRSFIVDAKFDNALSYLAAIPLETLTPADRRVFEGDAAEVIYGLILDYYKKSEYAKAVKVWDAYRVRYINKVANDTLMNYIISYSYIKLGLFDAFDKHYAAFSKLSNEPEKTFPIWVERNRAVSREIFLDELKIVRNLKLGNMELAVKFLKEMEIAHPTEKKINYFKGMIAFKDKKYKECADYLEQYIVSESDKVNLDGVTVADMLIAFAESLYELGQVEKYKRVVETIENDSSTWGNDQEELGRVKRRVAYLYIEILASEGKQDSYARLEVAISNYRTKYGKTTYDERLQFLLGVAYVANKKTDEGRKAFEALINASDVSEYIKDLARSELALIRIGERNL